MDDENKVGYGVIPQLITYHDLMVWRLKNGKGDNDYPDFNLPDVIYMKSHLKIHKPLNVYATEIEAQKRAALLIEGAQKIDVNPIRYFVRKCIGFKIVGDASREQAIMSAEFRRKQLKTH
ncbi:hypothetical protein [Citrobacter portucalensis]|uniref:hypothetical protein n=1 Tax=Citrobacter portucalensis TaxID=1639133 RepID=UPI0024DEEDC9|nr:hypothetical protein [Citrobacter portucalensis]MDK2579196.1 hypothetical protein [Citrobacter portucalensis]